MQLETATARPAPANPPPRVAPPTPRFVKREKRTGSNWLVHVALITICFLALVPFLWMVLTSLKTATDAMAFPPQLIPKPIMWGNYLLVFHDGRSDFLLWARNSVVVALLCVVGTTLSSAVVAYGFAKLNFRGRGVFFAIMLGSMMIPFPVTMVSLFALFRWLATWTGVQWLGTFKPLWVPAFFGSAFSIFLLRQFFVTIPNELSESARLDGCSEVGIFFRIIIPLSKPALTVVALFAFMAAWNDFLGPMIFLQRPEQFTLALGLQNFQSQQGGTPWHLLMAASVLVILPVLLIYFVAQKTFVEGISTTGMKG